MNKIQNIPDNQNSGSMLYQKTNEDYNNEKPNPNTPDFKIANGKNMRNGDQGTSNKKTTEIKSKKSEAIKTYTCPMHPEVKSGKPGKCSKCGMELQEKKQGIYSKYSVNKNESEKTDFVRTNQSTPAKSKAQIKMYTYG